MKLSKSFSRISVLTVVLAFFALPFWFASCKAVPPSSETTESPAEIPAEEAPSLTETKPSDSEPAEKPGEGVPPGISPDGDAENYAETRPEPQEKDELTIAFSKSELELDFRKSFLASEAQLFTAIYEGLFSYNPVTMAPVAAAASNWEVSEDKKKWTFTIRENAKFENGDPLRAEDFRAAWLSLLAPGKDSPYSSLFDIIEGARDFRLGSGGADAVGISAPNDKTLVVRLNSPAAFFSSMLCHHSFSPVHPSMLNEENWLRPLPVSNGPFRIGEIDEDHIVFLKNPEYWDARRVNLNKITVLFTDDGDEATAMWNSGAARWIHGDINIDTLTDRSGIEVNAMFATHYYYIRSARKPWDDFRLRRALSLVLPWEKIREGHSLPAKSLIFPISGYPEIDGLVAADVEEARRLLAEAGYAEGAGLPELVIRITPSPEAERVAALMAEAWFTNLGVPVKIDVVSYRQYFGALKQDDYDVGSTTWIGDFADPYTFLQMWCKDSNLNDARHNDSDYETLIDKSMTEEGEKRWETLAEAETLLLERGNVLPVSYSPAVNIISLGEIEGWYPNVLDIHPFKYLEARTRRPRPGVVMNKTPGQTVAELAR